MAGKQFNIFVINNYYQRLIDKNQAILKQKTFGKTQNLVIAKALNSLIFRLFPIYGFSRCFNYALSDEMNL